MAIGLSLSIINVNIWYQAVIIGVVTSLFSLLGLRLGKIPGRKVGKEMEIICGMVLILIGIRVVVSHLVA